MEYSNSNILKQFAAEMNGEFIDRNYHHSAKAELKHSDWKVIFDNYTEYKTSGGKTFEQIYARVISPIKSSDNFRFEICRKNIFSSITKIFGAQDIEIGNSEFDKAFVIKANNEFKLKAFLNNKSLRTQIENQDRINLQISDQKGIWEDKLPEREFELSFFIEEPINDSQKLKSIYSLFAEMLNQLKDINSIQASG
jgi:hypothetical protein